MPALPCPHAPECDYKTDPQATISEAITLLEMHERAKHKPTESHANHVKADKVKRPVVTSGGTNEDWGYFLTRWSEYTTATNIPGRDKVLQLLECCDEQLRRDLTRSVGGSISSKTEEEVLQAMKKLAVREENAMVARFMLNQMQQDSDEPVRKFGARIKGQASICKYTTPCQNCDTKMDYTEEILRDVLARGLSDTEIQLSLLSDKNQNMSLEEMYNFVESKESGKRSIDKLSQAIGASAMRSSTYNRGKKESPRQPFNEQPAKNDECQYCGQKGHGKKPSFTVRKSSCPAYGKVCDKCKKNNHFGSVCLAKKSATTENASTENGSTSNTLCASTSKSSRAPHHVLEHHIYNDLQACWRKENSRAQPYMMLAAATRTEDYEAHGFGRYHRSSAEANLQVMADTGCQSCLAGMKALQRLNIKKENLIPVTLKMNAANNTQLNILGAAVIRFSGISSNGENLVTKQIVYVTDNTDKIYLSREGCISLGLISKDFPTIGEARKDSCATLSDPLCDCPERTPTPPRPQEIPYAPTEENRQKLKDWLLEYYKHSTFNTCEHQHLPKMDTPPLRLMISDDAIPKASHKAIPVPLHWLEKVKSDLDRDVQLGVIEPVPIGDPVVWCHRMVVTAKKNGDPRRTGNKKYSLGGSRNYGQITDKMEQKCVGIFFKKF